MTPSPLIRRLREERSAGDEGAILLLALIFIAIIGLVLTSILTQTSVGLATVTVDRQYVTKHFAADAGLRYGLQQVRANPELCGTPLINPPTDFLTSFGNAGATNQSFPTVTVTCSLDPGQPNLGANGYAIITHDTDDASGIATTGGSTNVVVNGPIFVSSHPSSLAFTLHHGNAYTLGNSPCAAKPGGLILDPGHLWTCFTPAPTTPAVTLPTDSYLSSMVTRGPNPIDVPASNCSVFAPGKYTSIKLNAGSKNNPGQNYFGSGVYYFDNVTIDLTNQVLFGGAPHNGTTYLGNIYNETSALGGPPDNLQPCSDDTDGSLAGQVTGSGVKIILGGTSKIVIDNPKGFAELYARWAPNQASATAEGTQAISVMTVQSGASAGWHVSGYDYTGECIGQNNFSGGGGGGGGGSTMGIAIHGRVYTPNCLMGIRDNIDVGQFYGGLDVGRLNISTSNNVGNFAIAVGETSTVRGMTITSSAVGGDGGTHPIVATAHVAVDNVGNAFNVTSWRND